jgi:hypothetical protein
MSDQSMPAAESRVVPRLRVPAMYTLLRARPIGQERYIWTGYIYDVSLAGMRFELDHALEPGAQIEVRGMLPGASQTTFRATGHIIRYHDDPAEPGPIRMAMVFDSFHNSLDELRLGTYLSTSGLRAA